MQRKVYHVTKQGDQWKATERHASRASIAAETKAMVVKQTVAMAKRQQPSQVVIHKENGVIQEERTFGQDPEKYPG